MKYILGRKLNMTQIFDESGVVTPVTAVVALPNTVTKVKTVESDGYNEIGRASCRERVSSPV